MVMTERAASQLPGPRLLRSCGEHSIPHQSCNWALSKPWSPKVFQLLKHRFYCGRMHLCGQSEELRDAEHMAGLSFQKFLIASEGNRGPISQPLLILPALAPVPGSLPSLQIFVYTGHLKCLPRRQPLQPSISQSLKLM